MVRLLLKHLCETGKRLLPRESSRTFLLPTWYGLGFLRSELTRVCCCGPSPFLLDVLATASDSLCSFTCFVFKCFFRFEVLKLTVLIPPLATFRPQILHVAIVLAGVPRLKYFQTADIFSPGLFFRRMKKVPRHWLRAAISPLPLARSGPIVIAAWHGVH